MALPHTDVHGTLQLGISSNLINEHTCGTSTVRPNPEHGVVSAGRQRTALEFMMNPPSLLDSLSTRRSEIDPFSSQTPMLENFSSLSGMNSLSQQPILEALPIQPASTDTLMSQSSNLDSQQPPVMYTFVSQPSIEDSLRPPLIDSLPSLPLTLNTLSSQSALTVQITKNNSLTEERIPLFKSIDSLVFYVPTSVAVVPRCDVGNESTIELVENSNFISLNENEGPCENLPPSLSPNNPERNAAVEADVFSDKQPLSRGLESLENRLAERNALLPPRRRRRSAPKAIFGCHGCGKTFKNAVLQSKHVAVCKRAKDEDVTEKSTDQTRHVCPVCLVDFPRALLLQDHMNFVHNKKRPITCPQCPKKFYRPHDLKIHLNIHFNIKNYVCDTCGRQFHHISNLKRHQRTHSGVRPYACEHCLKRFTQVVSLRMHLKRHIKNGVAQSLSMTQSRRFYCHVCGKTFRTKAQRVAHEKETHGDKDGVSCKTCDRTFNLSDDLKNHTCNRRRRCKNLKKGFSEKYKTNNTSTVKELDSSKRPFLQRFNSSDESLSSTVSPRVRSHYNVMEAERTEPSVSVTTSNISCIDTLVMYLSENGNHLSYVVKKESSMMHSETGCAQFEPDTITINVPHGASSEPSINYTSNVNLKDTPTSDTTEKFSSLCQKTIESDLPVETIKIEVTENETPEDHVCFNDEVLVHTVISDTLLDDCLSPKSEDTDGDNNHSDFNVESGSVPPPYRQPLDALSSHTRPQNGDVSNLSSNIWVRKMTENSPEVPQLALHKSPTPIMADFRSVQPSSLMNADCETFSLESSDAVCEISDILSNTGLQNTLLEFPESTQFFSPQNVNSVFGPQKLNKTNYISKEEKTAPTALTNSLASSVTKGDDANGDIKDIPSNRGSFRCRVCSKTFNRKWNLEQHEGLHNPDQQRYRCPHCRRSFAYRTTYTTHLRSHSDVADGVACPVCGKEFKSKGAMDAHGRRVHQKIKLHRCGLCERSFHQRAELAYHLRLHSKEQPYMCYSCSRTFAHSSNLLRHERQHSGEKPHRCSFCARGFIQAVGLKRHLKKHHLEEQRQQQELENSDSEPVQPSKTISPKPFQSSEQFSLKLPMCLPPKGPIAPPSIACEEAAIHSHVTSNNSDLFRCNIDSLDSLAKSKLLNDDGSADVDAEADMFAVIAGHDTNTSSVLHDGNTSALRQRSEEAFSTDIPDNVISNIGDVYGIIFMQ